MRKVHLFGLHNKPELQVIKSFLDVAEHEPLLMQLAMHIEMVMATRNRQDLDTDMMLWHAPMGFKSQMSQLAGFHAEAVEIRTMAAYDACYDLLYYWLIEERRHRTVAFEKVIALFESRVPRSLQVICPFCEDDFTH